jgi:hypothetical protein
MPTQMNLKTKSLTGRIKETMKNNMKKIWEYKKQGEKINTLLMMVSMTMIMN